MNSFKLIFKFLSLGKIKIQHRFPSMAFYNLSLNLGELLWGEKTSFDERQKIVMKSM